MRKKIDLNFEEMDFSDIECEQIDVVEYEYYGGEIESVAD